MTSAVIPQQTTTRLLSLDVLRGLTIAFMILVNNNGDEAHAYWALKHTAWNGFTPTDLVFPTFLFLIGVSITFSTASRLAKGATRQSLFFHTLRRTVILFLLGLLVNSYPHFNLHTLRIYGVLPRLALCYFIAATLYIISPTWRDKVAIAIAALLGYWILMRFIPVPGLGLGAQAIPTHDIPILDRDANLTAWLDRQIFSASHLYERTRDPEGLLSTLPALATALIGLLTGEWLRTTRTLTQKARGIAIAGLTSVLLGALWNPWFPVNKKLWTSSFVLYAAGWSLLLLALSIWLTDIRNAKATTPQQKKTFAPLLVFGTNAIATYVFSELLQSTLTSIHLNPTVDPKLNLQIRLFQLIHNIIPNAPFASLLYSIAFVIVCWLAIYPLYRRQIFIKI
jgi:predicted acyltransferase